MYSKLPGMRKVGNSKELSSHYIISWKWINHTVVVTFLFQEFLKVVKTKT